MSFYLQNESSTSSSISTLILNDINEDVPSVDLGRLALLIASYVIGILGVLGNGLVIIVCFCYPLRGVTNVLVCNQSVIDLLSSIMFLLRYGVFSNIILTSRSSIAADFVCKIWVSEYPVWALAVASTGNLVYLTIERYIAVFHPIAYRQKFTKLKAKLFSILPWIIGLLHELPWAVTHRVQDNECIHQWWTAQIGFIIGIIVPINHYVLPLAVMGYVYTRVLLKLRAVGPAATDNAQRNTYTSKASRNVIKTMFVVSFTYLICWGPNEILYFYSNMGGYVDWNGVLYYYTVVSALSNMSVNPFIYAFHYQDFRSN